MSSKARKYKTYDNDTITKNLINVVFDDVNKIEKKIVEIYINASNAFIYLDQLLVGKDKIFRQEQNLHQINETDPSRYAKMLIETNPIVIESTTSVAMADGYLCKKCHKRTGNKTLKQFRRGDEGAALVIQCSRSSCGYIYTLSG